MTQQQLPASATSSQGSEAHWCWCRCCFPCCCASSRLRLLLLLRCDTVLLLSLCSCDDVLKALPANAVDCSSAFLLHSMQRPDRGEGGTASPQAIVATCCLLTPVLGDQFLQFRSCGAYVHLEASMASTAGEEGRSHLPCCRWFCRRCCCCRRRRRRCCCLLQVTS